MGLRLRVSDARSPWRGHRCCLQACTHPGQDPIDTKISELNTIHSRTATPGPFILASFLCTLQRWTSGERLVTTHFAALIPTLQHSIRSLWLGATPAGFTPACHQTISSPHVHWFVIRISLMSAHRGASTQDSSPQRPPLNIGASAIMDCCLDSSSIFQLSCPIKSANRSKSDASGGDDVFCASNHSWQKSINANSRSVSSSIWRSTSS